VLLSYLIKALLSRGGASPHSLGAAAAAAFAEEV